MNTSIPDEKFYVYLLRRNGAIFYVGKGSGNRITAHEDCALKHSSCRHLTCRVIRKSWLEGKDIEREKVCDNVTEETSFIVERLMISVGFASGWPLVNLTSGGEGASGYRWTEEQRKERSQRAREDIASIERMKTINIGRKHTEEVKQKRNANVKQTWSDPTIREKQKESMKRQWQDPEMRQRRLDGQERAKAYIVPRRGFTPTNTKTYPGFVSPQGIIHEQVFNLTQFCKDNDLQKSNMCLVASGKQVEHKGWTAYPPMEVPPPPRTYFGSGFVSPDGTVYQDIEHLKSFCKEHDLHPSAMCRVAKGQVPHHKGWTVYQAQSNPTYEQLELFGDRN